MREREMLLSFRSLLISDVSQLRTSRVPSTPRQAVAAYICGYAPSLPNSAARLSKSVKSPPIDAKSGLKSIKR